MKKHLGKISVVAVVAVLASLGKLGNDLLDMRAKWSDQKAKAAADSVYVANRLERLENLLAANGVADVKLERRVSRYHVPRFERSAPAASGLRADSVSVRSPGPIQVLGIAVTAPFKWGWAGLKAVFGPRKEDG